MIPAKISQPIIARVKGHNDERASFAGALVVLPEDVIVLPLVQSFVMHRRAPEIE